MTTDPRSQEYPMSEQDLTNPITVDEQWSLRRSAPRPRPEPPYRLMTQRPSDFTGDPADDTMACAISGFVVTSPPDHEAMRLVREALPVGAPGIEVEQVLAAMPTTQSEAATLRALNALVADQYVTRQQDYGQRSAFYRSVPPPSRAAAASVFPPSRVDLGLRAGTPRPGKSSFPNPTAARRRALSDSVREALPAGAPGITAEQVHHRVGGDVAAEDLREVLHDLAVFGAITAHDYMGAPSTYHHREEGEWS